MDIAHPLDRFVRRLQSRAELQEETCRALQRFKFSLLGLRRGMTIGSRQHPNHLMVVADGVAARFKTTGSGARQIVSFYVPGDPLNLQDRFVDDAEDQIEGVGAASLVLVPWPSIDRLCATNPELRAALWRSASTEMSILREWLTTVGRREAEKRLGHLLCELIVRLKAVGLSDGTRMAWPFRQEHLADAAGMTAVHVNRMLRRLREKGFATVRSGIAEIGDWDRLREFAEFDEVYLGLSTFRPTATIAV